MLWASVSKWVRTFRNVHTRNYLIFWITTDLLSVFQNRGTGEIEQEEFHYSKMPLLYPTNVHQREAHPRRIWMIQNIFLPVHSSFHLRNQTPYNSILQILRPLQWLCQFSYQILFDFEFLWFVFYPGRGKLFFPWNEIRKTDFLPVILFLSTLIGILIRSIDCNRSLRYAGWVFSINSKSRASTIKTLFWLSVSWLNVCSLPAHPVDKSQWSLIIKQKN